MATISPTGAGHSGPCEQGDYSSSRPPSGNRPGHFGRWSTQRPMSASGQSAHEVSYTSFAALGSRFDHTRRHARVLHLPESCRRLVPLPSRLHIDGRSCIPASLRSPADKCKGQVLRPFGRWRRVDEGGSSRRRLGSVRAHSARVDRILECQIQQADTTGHSCGLYRRQRRLLTQRSSISARWCLSTFAKTMQQTKQQGHQVWPST